MDVAWQKEWNKGPKASLEMRLILKRCFVVWFRFALLCNIFFDVYLFLRERETEHDGGRAGGRGKEREGNTTSEKRCRL